MNDYSRRQFLNRTARLAAAAALGARFARAATIDDPTTTATTAAATTTTTTTTSPATSPAAIDRAALVGRHAVTLTTSDPATALHVGNGDFAFGVDVTGLQTFAQQHADKFPLETLANWAWHAPSKAPTTAPTTEPTTAAAPSHDYTVGGRAVPYLDGVGLDPATLARLRDEPRRAPLARLGFVDLHGNPLTPDRVTNVRQTLDLWTGAITSHFDYLGERVEVVTVADPVRAALAVSIDTPALATGALAIQITFPRVSAAGAREADSVRRYGSDARLFFDRRLDALHYTLEARMGGDGTTRTRADADARSSTLHFDGTRAELTLEFVPEDDAAARRGEAASFADTRDSAAAAWRTFWTDGAAIDFSACTDARAPELERRVVLGQYLTAVHCSGSMPAPSSGLAFDRPSGKAALEAQWWQAAHFAMWGRPALLERSMAFYRSILPAAQRRAQRQGYEGARWPSHCGPDGEQSPGEAEPFLIWQQPHVIYFAEAAYRAKRTREALDQYADLVDQTARFMVSYARADDANGGRFVLGPALVPAQQSYAYDRAHVLNPTFELAYWTWALGVAQKWRDRLGLPREESWDRVMQKLAKPMIREGRYAAIETEPFLINGDHPSFLFALGLVPKTHLIDDNTMRETAKWTRAKWKWNDAWGCDFAALAQTAARLGEAELAVDALLIESERNRWTATGHNLASDDRPVDLSANGAMLAAIALMAVGASEGNAPTDVDAPPPGFPRNGKWNVKVEGFAKVI